MVQVAFYDRAEDSVYKFAVIGAKKDGRWLLCRHGKRNTWECPGGHREAGERIEDTAKENCLRRQERRRMCCILCVLTHV